MRPFSWQCQNLYGLSLAFIIDWRVVSALAYVRWNNNWDPNPVPFRLREERQRRLRELQNPWSLDSYLQRQYQSHRSTRIPSNTPQHSFSQAAQPQTGSLQIPASQTQTTRGLHQTCQPQGANRIIQPSTSNQTRQPSNGRNKARQLQSNTTRTNRTRSPQPPTHTNERTAQTNINHNRSTNTCKAGNTLSSQVQPRHVEGRREPSEIIDIEEPCYEERDFNQGVLVLNDEYGEKSFQDGILNLDESQVQSNILFEKHYTTLVKRLQRFF